MILSAVIYYFAWTVIYHPYELTMVLVGLGLFGYYLENRRWGT